MEQGERKVGEPDAMLQIAFSLDEVRDLRQEVMATAGAHLSQVRPLSLRNFLFFGSRWRCD